LPLVIISSRDDTQARIRLLDLGADDYLVKPVRLDELAARLRVLLRRSRSGVQARGELRHGPLRVVPDSRSVSKDGSHVSLTATEYSLLEVLMRAKGEVLTRQSLEDLLKGRFDQHGGNPLEVHVHHLRRKLGAEVITTIRGVGYTLGNGSG